MENRCRLCAEYSADQSNALEDVDLIVRIFQLFNVKISIEDKLPTTVCELCVETVKQTWEFSQHVQKSQEVLNDILNTEITQEVKLNFEPAVNEVKIRPTEPVRTIKKEDLIQKSPTVNKDVAPYSEVEWTPVELRKVARKPVENLLPPKSSERYEKAYRAYKDWCVNKGIQNIDSESVILAYFGELAKERKPSTLWATYSMLRTTLNVRDQIDISKFVRLGNYLKKQNVGYKAKKSSIFTQQDIDRFLNEAPLKYLPQKVALIIGISGGCRSDELFKLKTSDIDFLDSKVSIVIPNTKTCQPRAFVITNAKWIAILRQYMNLRRNFENERFFLQLRFGKITRQPFGYNALVHFPKKIAAYLKLNNVDTFTGHCFKRTAANLWANGGHALHLESVAPEGYVDNSLDCQVKTEPMYE